MKYITGARGTDHPPFSNFLFTILFSIKFLYFFIVSSMFPYFNLFVSIFIQFYVNIKLHVHVSTLLDNMRQATLFEGRSPKISIIRWSVHVSLTGRNYEQFRWYWPWHLIIIYKFDQIDEADCMFIFQIKHQYSFWIIAHILFNALLRVLT